MLRYIFLFFLILSVVSAAVGNRAMINGHKEEIIASSRHKKMTRQVFYYKLSLVSILLAFFVPLTLKIFSK